MVRRKDKELDVALELFNNELGKIQNAKKAQAAIQEAERNKEAAIKALKDAEGNPNLSSEEKAAAKEIWVETDKKLKQILTGENIEAVEEGDQAEIIDEPDVLGCGVAVEEMQETVDKEKAEKSDLSVVEETDSDTSLSNKEVEVP
ncbi:MAG: hypothetical protein P8J01_08125 [Acidimicrobiales bacterium]|nr:hypothetical protein [Acidimicrobiales bacterium]